MSEQAVAAVVHRIRLWLVQYDRYNGSTIELDELLTREIGALVGARALQGEQSDDAEVVNAVTAVVREADRTFERVGGSSRHWVRDCFLPLLNKAGFVVVESPQDGK